MLAVGSSADVIWKASKIMASTHCVTSSKTCPACPYSMQPQILASRTALETSHVPARQYSTRLPLLRISQAPNITGGNTSPTICGLHAQKSDTLLALCQNVSQPPNGHSPPPRDVAQHNEACNAIDMLSMHLVLLHLPWSCDASSIISTRHQVLRHTTDQMQQPKPMPIHGYHR